jgi:hypothetical protein
MPIHDSFPTRMDRESLALLQHIHPQVYAWSQPLVDSPLLANGYWLTLPSGQAVINPPCVDEYLHEAFRALAKLDVVILTREACVATATEFCQLWDIPCLAPAVLHPLLLEAGLPAEQYVPLKVGMELFDCLHPIFIETCIEGCVEGAYWLYWPEQRALFTDDAVQVLASSETTAPCLNGAIASVEALQHDLQQLLQYQGMDTLLPSLGEPLLGDA